VYLSSVVAGCFYCNVNISLGCLFFVSLLFLKIDKDGDNRVSPAELQSWMRHVQQESMDTETDRQWSEFRRKDPDFLAWDEYVQHTYKDNKGISV